jgi:hypothetical protein
MAGLSVDEPIGTDWEYSLDAISYQAIPFWDDLVIGMLYNVYCRHITTGVVIWDQVRVGGEQSAVWVPPTEAQADAIIDLFSETGLGRLSVLLSIPEPAWFAPDETQQNDLRLAMDRQRRGGFDLPLSGHQLLCLAWQMAPIIQYYPNRVRPDDYAPLVDDDKIDSIAGQIAQPMQFTVDLSKLKAGLVLEQAEVNLLAQQLTPLYDFSDLAPGIEEQLLRLPRQVKASVILDFVRSLEGDELAEYKAMTCCQGGGDDGNEDDDDVVVTILSHWTPVTTPPPSPQIESVRRKTTNDTWVLYIQTNPVSTAGATSPAIYYRVKTENGGAYDSGFLPATWGDTNYNAAGRNEPSGNGDANYDTNIYSATERSAGYYGLIYANTSTSDPDDQHTVIVELSMNADGSNPIQVSFVVTSGMNESVSTAYTRSV